MICVQITYRFGFSAAENFAYCRLDHVFDGIFLIQILGDGHIFMLATFLLRTLNAASIPTAAPDMEAITQLCQDLKVSPPVFENGCYTVSFGYTKCNDQAMLISLHLRDVTLKSVPESIGKLVNLQELCFNMTQGF